MCVILYIPAGFMPKESDIENATWNNPHGWGYVIRKGDKLLHEKILEGDNDPEKVYELIDKYKKYDRYIHLRWKTRGDISLENTQPFMLLGPKHKNGPAFFMHNGTLGTWGESSTTMVYNQAPVADPKAGMSDSRDFAENFLKGIMEKWQGDVDDKLFGTILDRFWISGNSRGIIIQPDSHTLLSKNQWKLIDHVGEGDKRILASNDDYFSELKRGPVYEKMQAEKKAEEEKRSANNQTSHWGRNHNTYSRASSVNIDDRIPWESSSGEKRTTWAIERLKDWEQVHMERQGKFADLFDEIFSEFNLYDRDELVHMENLTTDETLTVMRKDPEMAAALFVYLASEFAGVMKELDALKSNEEENLRLEQVQAKLDRATRIIAGQKKLIEDMEKSKKPTLKPDLKVVSDNKKEAA